VNPKTFAVNPDGASNRTVLVKRGEVRAEGPGPEKTGGVYLYSNPIGAVMDFWTKKIGEPFVDAVKQFASDKIPDEVQYLFTNNFRQSPAFVEAVKIKDRRIAEGHEKAVSLGRAMSEKLTQGEQQVLGELFRGEASEALLKAMRDDPRWMEAVEAVKVARATFDDFGAQAAMEGLLSQETFFKNYGKYMPRMYRRWEVDYEAQLKEWGVRRPTRLDLDRFKELGDIPEEVRAMMGEIKEPAYPVAKGLSQLIHDVETAKLFNFVANNTEWTFKGLDNLFDAGKNKADYVQMPKNANLGRLSGQYVEKYIAKALNGMIRSKGEATKIGQYLISEWKFNKVIFNPATHGRNMVSNAILAYLSGLPPWRVDIYSKAMMELYRQKGENYELAKAEGLFQTTFAEGEMDGFVDSWAATHGGLYDRMAGMAENFKKGEYAEAAKKVPLRISQTKVGQKAGKLYQAEEAWFKLAKFIQGRENGLSPKQAAFEAQKALFDYTDVPPAVEWARRSPFGAPFITFTYKALPMIAESAVTHPWRLAGAVYGLYAIQDAAREALGISEDEFAKIKGLMPERLRGDPMNLGPKALLLPFKDKYGQLQFLDLTYILPWGDIGETGRTGIPQGLPLVASPARTLFEIILNTNSYTGEDVWDQTDTLAEATGKISQHLYRFWAPSLAPGGYGFDRLQKSGMGVLDPKADYFGRVSSVGTAVASAILGMKTNPINPDIELFFREREYLEALGELEKKAISISGHAGLSEAEKRTQIEQLTAKAKRLNEMTTKRLEGRE